MDSIRSTVFASGASHKGGGLQLIVLLEATDATQTCAEKKTVAEANDTRKWHYLAHLHWPSA